MQVLMPTPGLLIRNWEWAPEICGLRSLSGDSDSHWSLRSTGLKKTKIIARLNKILITKIRLLLHWTQRSSDVT